MNDIAPAIYEKVNKRFEYYISRDDAIKKATKKLEDGTATFQDAYYYAQAVGNCLSDAFSLISEEELPDGKMYYNIAQRTVEPMLSALEDKAAAYCNAVQEKLNHDAGLGLKAV